MKDALMQALKAYGGPDGLLEDLKMFAESRKEEAQATAERITDKPKATRADLKKLRVAYALEDYWAHVEETLDSPAQELYTGSQTEEVKLVVKSTGKSVWRVNPERITLK